MCETLPALITCEQSLSSVDPHVNLETLFVRETLSTLITFMQFLSSVDDHVTLKVSLLCETLPATDHMCKVSLQCGSSRAVSVD